MKDPIKIIGFDADDTLWVNEPLYQQTEKKFCEILKPYLPEDITSKELFKTEMQNLELYGYGAKGFILSLIETAIRITEGALKTKEIAQILNLGKKLLNEPIELLDGVVTVLEKLKSHYKLILATKGDLLDQERKLEKSGLSDYFHHIEIMSDKQQNNYNKLLTRLEIKPHEFLMIGNSVKSDILPVVQIGARAIHVPFSITWLHEKTHEQSDNKDFITVEKLINVLNFL
jgi:putative hydrolase of the HAD superfamily